MEKHILKSTGEERNKVSLMGAGESETKYHKVFPFGRRAPDSGQLFWGHHTVPGTKCFTYIITLVQQQQSHALIFLPILQARKLRLREVT